MSAAGLLGVACMLACATVRERAGFDPRCDVAPDGAGTALGVVVSSPEPRGQGWEWVEEVRRVEPDTTSLRRPVRLAVRLASEQVPQGVAPGAWLRTVGDFDPLQPPRNPGGADLRGSAFGRGICGWQRVRDAAGVEIVKPAGAPAQAGERLRARIRAELGRGLSDRARPYGASLLLGETAGLPEEDRDGLVALGVIHIVIIAGLHLHLLHAAVSRATGWLGCSGGLRSLLALCSVAGYAWLSHFHLPAQRVLLSLAWAEVARLRGLPHSSGRGAAVAAAALLLQEPARACDPSYVLSVSATWGIHELGAPRAGAGPWRPAADLLRASLLTQVAVWPLLPWTVGRGSLVGLPANLVAVPLAALLLVSGVCAVGWSLAGVAGAALVWRVPQAAGTALASIARLGWDRLGSGATLGATPTCWIVAGLAALLVAAHGPRSWRARALVLYGVVAALMALGPRTAPSASPYVRVAFLDVGQGDACVITFPRGESVLVDGGPARPGWDSGARVVAPALDALGIRELAWASASHSDNDHAGGLCTLAHQARSRRWILPPARAGGKWRPLQRSIRDAGQRWEHAGAGWVWMDESGADTVRALYPDTVALGSGLAENNLCMVLECATPEGRFLLPGDLEAGGEAALAATRSLRPCVLLKVPHHGSRTSSTEPLLTSLGHPTAVISVGKRNAFGHPSTEVEERLRRWTGGALFETRESGALLFELRPEGPRRVEAEAWTRVSQRTGAPCPLP